MAETEAWPPAAPAPSPAGATLQSEVAQDLDLAIIRYGQCWEDADILLQALAIQPGDTCLSIASAGDNTLALLTRQPGRVIALDLSPAQMACLELRVAAYRALSHPELLALVGSRPSHRRPDLYRRCWSQLSPAVRRFWDTRMDRIAAGIGAAGKFEGYFTLFRRYVLPLVHSQRQVRRLLAGGNLAQREAFYQAEWNTWRWRLAFRLFFSRRAMGRLGRDPRLFQYVQGDVAGRILERVRHALTHLDPSENPYLQWILTGHHPTALPLALRPEHFETIRQGLDRLEWRCQAVESFLAEAGPRSIHRFNLSDIFEYMSQESYEALLERLADAGHPGARLAYWNLLVPRQRPTRLDHRLQPLTDLAARLHQADNAFFYSAFVVEEVR